MVIAHPRRKVRQAVGDIGLNGGKEFRSGEWLDAGPLRWGGSWYKVLGPGGLEGARARAADTTTRLLSGEGGSLACWLPGPAQ